ncbi:hypothetical protein V8F06_005038 [Rhypophila decipiens]
MGFNALLYVFVLVAFNGLRVTVCGFGPSVIVMSFRLLFRVVFVQLHSKDFSLSCFILFVCVCCCYLGCAWDLGSFQGEKRLLARLILCGTFFHIEVLDFRNLQAVSLSII